MKRFIKMLLFLITLLIAYSLICYMFPNYSKKADDFLNIWVHEYLANMVATTLGKAQEIEQWVENYVENPAPNTTENIKGRMGN